MSESAIQEHPMCASLKYARGRSFARRCGGWGAAEYLVVLVGLMATWRGAQIVLTLVREHYREFSWSLMLPF